jgi:chemotaxis protein methyltransferase CheR
VIYFTEEAKQNLYLKFYDSLMPGGYLLVGGTEPLLAYRQLGFVSISASFYQKPKSNADERAIN